ncbi:MAG TPA: efflux RND transporter periplasmic adaptor subunit [Terriglobales bacterium]|nr:efflux RND transporter periplasmic adaptor subunit [Terriglobales bacterium]
MAWIKRNKWVVIVVPVIVIIALIAALSKRSVIPVRAESAHRESISNTISTNGKIEPIDNFEAHAPAPASVKRVLVKPGQQVRAGQLLVQLDDSDARAQSAKALAQLKAAEADVNAVRGGGTHEEVLTTQANLTKAQTERDSAQRNLDAVRKLQQTGSASAGEVTEAENRLQRANVELQLLQQRKTGRYSNPEIARVQAQAAEARAAYTAAKDLLSKSNITSPRAGTVYSLPVREGSFVNAGDLIVQVADLKKMQVRAFVDEPEIGKLAQNQRATITWDAVPGREWEGVITRVPSTVVQRGTRNVGEVVAAVDNKDLKLLPNVNVNVLVTTEKADSALTVSREAVLQNEGRRYVFAINGDKLRRRDVETGIANLTRIQIIKGIDEGTKVALGSANQQALYEGAPVKLVQ